MKALCIRQPWAGWIAEGRKTIETRTWRTTYRGPLLIVASKTVDLYAAAKADLKGRYFDLRGQAIAIGQLVSCRPMIPSDESLAMCPCYPGRIAWRLKDVRPLREPFPVAGRLGLFEVVTNEDMTPLYGFTAN